MHPLLAFAFRSRNTVLRLLLVAVLLSVPLVTLTSSDYLTLSTLDEIEGNMTLAIQVSDVSLEEFLHTLEILQAEDGLRNVSAMSVVVLHDANLESGNITIGSPCVMVGLSDWPFENGSIAMDSASLRYANIEAGKNVTITNEEHGVNETYFLANAFELDSSRSSLVLELENSERLEKETRGVRIYGSLSFIYNQSLSLLPQLLGLSPIHAQKFILWSKLAHGTVDGTYAKISERISNIVNKVTDRLSRIGNVIVVRDPQENLSSIRSVYDQLESSLLTVTLPAIGGCVIFLFVAAWIHFESVSVESSRLSARGVSRNQLLSVYILEGAIVGLIGGIVSLPVGSLLSFVTFGMTPESWMQWFEVMTNNPFFTIGGTLIASVVLVVSAVIIAFNREKASEIHDSGFKRWVLVIFFVVVIFVDVLIGFKYLLFLMTTSAEVGSLTLSLLLYSLVISELVILLFVPIVAPLAFAKLYSLWSSYYRQIFSRIVHIDQLVSKGLAAPLSFRKRFLFVTMILVFIISSPAIAQSEYSSMQQADVSLQMGGDIRITITGVNASLCETNLTKALSNLDGVKTVAWAGLLDIDIGLAHLLDKASLFVVSDRYFSLSSVQRYFPDVPDGAMISALMAEDVHQDKTIPFQLDGIEYSTVSSGIFYFLPGLQDDTFQFQSYSKAVIMDLSHFESDIGRFNGTSSILMVDTEQNQNITEIDSRLTDVINSTLQGLGVVDINTADNMLETVEIENKIAIAGETFLILAGLLSIVLIVSLDLKRIIATATTLLTRGASSQQVISGIIFEEVGLLLPTFLLGVVGSASYFYGLTVASLIIINPFIRQLPQGYGIQLPLIIPCIFILMFAILVIVTLIQVKRWHVAEFRKAADIVNDVTWSEHMN